MSNVYYDAGCGRHAYSPIVGSGPNGVILHYDQNLRRFDAGELVLMDVGAECDRYAADITRTVPADGHFTERQREIYEIVLGAEEAVIAAVKPGMSLGKSGSNSLYQIALDYLNSHGRIRTESRSASTSLTGSATTSGSTFTTRRIPRWRWPRGW